jgi:HEAT repeat protein
MIKRVHIALAVLLVMLAGVIAWQAMRQREPVYQGKRLSVWLEVLNRERTPSHPDDRVAQAIRHMGTNALPVLIERLHGQDTRLKQLMVAWTDKQERFPFHLKSADQCRSEAISGYQALGPLASSQVPRLTDMLEHDPFPNARQAAAQVLGFIGPEARGAAPALFRATKDKASGVRSAALFALGRIQPDAEMTIPVLVAGLDDPHPGAQWQAAIALGQYGPEARAALPALLRTLATNRARALAAGADLPPHDSFNDAFRSALKAIDPEAAAKAGVK